MYLPTVNGMRTFEGANSLMDIPSASRAAGTVNATGLNTSDFGEFIAVGTLAPIGAGAGQTVQFNVQESDTVAGTYTNIAGATSTLNATNTARVISVNCKHPDRKPFMRIQAVGAGANNNTFGAMSMRVQPKAGVISNDTNVVAVY